MKPFIRRLAAAVSLVCAGAIGSTHAFTIYDEGFGSSWSDGSWNASYQFDDPSGITLTPRCGSLTRVMHHYAWGTFYPKPR